MCLILFAYQQHTCYPLIVAANRDEYYQRPTASLDFWPDDPAILAGRDLTANGTWLGINRNGRFAALTNYRSNAVFLDNAPSRGELVRNFLSSEISAAEFAQQLAARAEAYNGFNILLKDQQELVYFCNRSAQAAQILPPGLYGLSNHLLDTPWPKVERGRTKLKQAISDKNLSVDNLLELLDDRSQPADETLPETSVSLARERALATIFIDAPDYGTRSSTALFIDQTNAITMAEKNQDDGKTRVYQIP